MTKQENYIKKIFQILIFLFIFQDIHSENRTDEWTLEKCIQYATENNINIKQYKLECENVEIQLHTSKMSRLPDLNGSITQRWDFGKTSTTRKDENGNIVNEYGNVADSNTSFGLSSNIPLFTGFLIGNQIDQKKLELNAALLSLEQAKEDLSLNITYLYLQALLQKELLEVKEKQVNLSKDQTIKTEALVNSGRLSESYLYIIQAQVAQDEVAYVEAKNNLELSLFDLAQNLELPDSEPFDIVSPELNNEIMINPDSLFSLHSIYDNALDRKPNIKAQNLRIEIAQKSLKIVQSDYYPHLSLSLNIGTNYFYDYNNREYNVPFKDQISNNIGNSILFNMNIPIFNRFSVRNREKAARLSIKYNEYALENLKKNIFKEIETAYLSKIAAREKYLTSLKAVQASQISFQYAEEKYKIGRLTIFEFNEIKILFIKSLSEQVQSKYDYIFRSKILDFYNGVPITL